MVWYFILIKATGKGGKGGKGGKAVSTKNKKAPQSKSARAGLQVNKFAFFLNLILKWKLLFLHIKFFLI